MSVTKAKFEQKGGRDDAKLLIPATVLLRYMFTTAEMRADKNFRTKLQANVEEECQKLGPVDSVKVFENHPEGVVLVRFKDRKDAQKCIELMNGRCLSEFSNLERLDLSSNTLTSLEGLNLCLNGIQALPKRTVLNAAKNKLTSMDDLTSLVTLRALILNDNEITSICRLEQMKELNTLVLSKNPIHDIGVSLLNVKSLTKLSLSHCELRSIQSSLKSCVELKEVRLAHNKIEDLPVELAQNKRLLNLDLGNNVITKWSDLKVLDSLVNLRNLNLLGNPIAEKDKLAKKIKKLLPNLHVFNARPIDKYSKTDKGAQVEALDEEQQKHRDSKHQGLGDSNLDNAGGFDTKRKRNREKANENVSDQVHGDEEGNSIKKRNRHQVVNEDFSNPEDATDLEESKGKKLRKKGHKDDDTKIKKNLDQVNEDLSNLEDAADLEESKGKKLKKKGQKDNDTKIKKELAKVKQQSELDIIDDADTPFSELFSDEKMLDAEDNGGRSKVKDKVSQGTKLLSGVVTITSSKAKKRSTGSTLPLLPVDEIGAGGASTGN